MMTAFLAPSLLIIENDLFSVIESVKAFPQPRRQAPNPLAAAGGAPLGAPRRADGIGSPRTDSL